jgi:hypothetical protein
MSHWVATLLLRSACTTALLAVACSPGSGHAERVDVPLHVAVSLVKPATWDCHANRCRLHVKAVIANDGDEHVWAMYCRAVGVDADGAVVTSGVLPTGPAGFAVDSGHSTTDFTTLPVSMRQARDVNSLSGTCRAYVWHGLVPI